MGQEENIRRDILLEEYRELNESIRHRGSMFATVQSILISGSLLAVTFALREPNLDKLIDSGIFIVAIFFVVVAWLMHLTATRLDKLLFKRIHQIEQDPLVQMPYGHHKTYDDIKDQWWYKLRRQTWNIVFWSLTIFYVGMLIWNVSRSYDVSALAIVLLLAIAAGQLYCDIRTALSSEALL